MNRTIKFRGKRIDNGEWVYGDLLQPTELCYIYEISDCESIDGTRYEVIPETIGQFTGLYDNTKKEIYENDIVTGIEYPFIDEGKQNYIGIVMFYDDVAQFGYEYKCIRKDKREISNGINNEFEANEDLICETLEIIGNITDNPELLGGE